MAKKQGKGRGAGEGSIFQRADGRWSGSISLGNDAGGKRQRKTVYGRTQAEVISQIESLRERSRTSRKSLLTKDSLGSYLARWLENDVRVNKSLKTHQEYELAVRLYVNPYLAAERLTALDGEKLVSWQSRLQKDGHSESTRLRAIRVLRNALNKAVKLRLLQFNPMAAVDKPKVIRKEVTPLEPAECHALFEVCRKYRLGELIILAALTGMRKGELFALQWDCVNLQEGILFVRRSLVETGAGLTVKEPKTAAGRRMVTLTSGAVQALQDRLQNALDEGFHPDEVPIVFPNQIGGHMRFSNFDRNIWYPIRQAAGIPESTKFHDLRHSHASLMLASGVDLKVIQKRLGHRDFATTANIYSHLLAGAQADASEKLDQMLSARFQELDRRKTT